MSMPELAKLDQEATPKGLVVLSVDENEDPKTATDFLAKHNYRWLNTQDDGKIGDAFKKEGIPLVVLIDPQGKIVFYKSGAEDAELRNRARKTPNCAKPSPALDRNLLPSLHRSRKHAKQPRNDCLLR